MDQRVLDFHFDYISPYSYLAWHKLSVFAPAHGLRVRLKPTLFAALLNEYGHKGPAEVPPKRIYMFKDCLRMATAMNVSLEPPASHPFNPLHALRASLLDVDEKVRHDLVSRLYAATWAESRDVGAPEVVAEVCAEVGISDALDRIRDAAVKRKLVDASADAVARGVFGVPTMIVDGEAFWGMDSFPHLERHLAGDDPIVSKDIERWAAVRATARRR